jgi:hypothetical protein
MHFDKTGSSGTIWFCPTTFYLEAKPRIRSVGALLRQVNLYRQYTPGSHWVVVCNDDRHRLPLQGQEIALVTPADISSSPLPFGHR